MTMVPVEYQIMRLRCKCLSSDFYMNLYEMLSSIVEMNASIKQNVEMWACLVVDNIYTLTLELIICEHLKRMVAGAYVIIHSFGCVNWMGIHSCGLRELIYIKYVLIIS